MGILIVIGLGIMFAFAGNDLGDKNIDPCDVTAVSCRADGNRGGDRSFGRAGEAEAPGGSDSGVSDGGSAGPGQSDTKGGGKSKGHGHERGDKGKGHDK